MWFHGKVDDWYNRSGLTIVKLPEEGRDPPIIFWFLQVGSVPLVSVASGALFPEWVASHTKNVTKQKFGYPKLWVTKWAPKPPPTFLGGMSPI